MEWIFCVGAVLLAAVLIIVWLISTSNDFKKKEIRIGESLSGVEVALTKRYDMLTKLMDVTKGYMSHEKDMFTSVIQLRRGMNINELNEAGRQIDELSAKVFAVAEGYPELRSAEAFVELQRGIRDAEEHLQAARRLHNSNVRQYNTAIVMFPASLIAGGRKPYEFFEAEAYKKNDVEIKF